MLILGIESSCDETSVAVVRDGAEVLSNIVLSQADIHAKYGGVVPEIASRAHTEAIYSLCEQALATPDLRSPPSRKGAEASGDKIMKIDAVAATYCPGLIGALLVGVNFGKALAYKLNAPFIPVNHIKAHVAAAYLLPPSQKGVPAGRGLKPPFLAFIASGGHTSIMQIDSYTDFKILGMTRDDAAGEAFDKTARAMGLDYPGGALIEKYADLNIEKTDIKIPFAKVEGSELDFSFSGVKTYIINYINTRRQKNGELPETEKYNIAAQFTDNIILSITSRIKRALEITGNKKLVCAGGVMANSHIKNALKDLCSRLNIELYIPDKKYCGDNAAMVAAQGFYEFQAGNTGGLSQNAFASADWFSQN
ncbi:MAG: tRNA (adenosine(37)-N6)-threonylcarbamoyltransferase complex transferase subunit TsaD [Oscillospiraceae bacterium]|nr:tRNA (adenosine(37)-N6)-threonylcarbamoyltransferase complex transferase subunit TsaD [Oscillospiraceae bacterium]